MRVWPGTLLVRDGEGKLVDIPVTATGLEESEVDVVTGPKGDPGEQGPMGPEGPMGPMGPRGLTGATGEQGPEGPAGPRGLAGATGEAGPVGPDGPQGEQGPQGPQGPKGDTGNAGVEGAQGIAGPAGQNGSQGLQGPKGDKGDQGIQGIQGIQGLQGPTGSGQEALGISGDVANSTTSFADVTGLQFPVVSGTRYWFRFVIPYSAAATTTGSRFSLNGPAVTVLRYRSEYTLTATARTINDGLTGYNLPAAANATSLAEGNLAIIEGVIAPSASGSVIARFASEVSASAITVRAGACVFWRAL